MEGVELIVVSQIAHFLEAIHPRFGEVVISYVLLMQMLFSNSVIIRSSKWQALLSSLVQ